MASTLAYFVAVGALIPTLPRYVKDMLGGGEALSYFSLALYGGLAAGPVIGESVLGSGHDAAAWLVAAACAALAAALGIKVPDTRSREDLHAGAAKIVHPAALMPGLVLACSVLGLAGFNTFVPLYALSIGLGESRLVFVVYSVIVLSIRSVGARIPDKMGPGRSARVALVISGAGLTVMSLWGNVGGLLGGTALFAVGQALTFPALMTIAVRSAPASERGSVVGTFTAFFDLAFGLGAVGLGGVAEVVGYRGAFASAAAVAFAGVALLLVRAQRTKSAEGRALREAA